MNLGQFQIKWTDAAVAELQRLWGAGETMTAIGAVLGYGRSAVAGKLRRIGAPRRRDNILTRAVQQPRKRRRQQKQDVDAARRVTRRAVRCGAFGHVMIKVTYVPTSTSLPAEAIPLAQRKTLLELGPHHCRFPYGDPGTLEFFFCGAGAADILANRPYCAFHTTQAWCERRR
jgi:GcrA cell cycle regulator